MGWVGKRLLGGLSHLAVAIFLQVSMQAQDYVPVELKHALETVIPAKVKHLYMDDPRVASREWIQCSSSSSRDSSRLRRIK
jgi:hypothetical protein